MQRKIKDNDSIQKLNNQISFVNLLIPFLRVFGFNKEATEFSKIKTESKRLIKLPDQYNERFSKYGWISHESLSPDIMEEAIKINDSNGFESAEKYLIETYELELENKLNYIVARSPFFERKNLIILAYNDYKEKRYYACVPVILLLLDGIVNDTKTTGLFSKNIDYEVWDSISGHATSLNTIMQHYKEEKWQTNYEKLTSPQRHGILHGLDLNFNNRTVAIKCFALLYFISDWLREVVTEEDRKAKHCEKKQMENNRSLKTVIKDYKENSIKLNEDKKLLEKWRKREKFTVDKSGIDTIEENQPEYVAFQFFDFIIKDNFGGPLSFYSNSFYGEVKGSKAKILRDSFNSIRVKSIENIIVEDIGSAKTEVIVEVKYTDGNDIEKNTSVTLNMLYEIHGEVENRLKVGGGWKIINIEGIGFKIVKDSKI